MCFRRFSATLYTLGGAAAGREKTDYDDEYQEECGHGAAVLSMLLWVLRKLNVLYVPGLSMILLAVSMIIVGIMMFQLKQKKKLAGTLIVAFGLFCVVAAIMEILSAAGKTF